ncbi:MAG: hypothetical protein H0V88_03850 [Pyrinomonadaceae bacterium]|nr:hypothetical protein [Pyrinomonadaceae bacterium]
MELFASFYDWFVLWALVAAVPIFLFGIVAAALSRHKGIGNGKVELIGSMGLTETNLKPEGAVLVRGELWRARSVTGEAVERYSRVRVKGARGHLLLVEVVALEK